MFRSSTATLTISNYNSGGELALQGDSPGRTPPARAGQRNEREPGRAYGWRVIHIQRVQRQRFVLRQRRWRQRRSPPPASLSRISNLDKPAYQFALKTNATNWFGIAFTTGTSTAGYTLTSFTAKFGEPSNQMGDIVSVAARPTTQRRPRQRDSG